MVTAIVIPLICIYFFWLSKKEMRESHQKWLLLKNVSEEAMISGEIVHIGGQKQRFSYNRFVYVLELTIQSELKKWKVKKIIPIEKNFSIPDLKTGAFVQIYGNWKKDYFVVSRIQNKN
ncbi:hypothetical protein [Cytobacillus dafuensis]|uniref:DUF4131 domain-containing protein n=1 Tax=Cytobacillus dafuensis TaxID=1742359 RepID=A0A5B8Z2Z0_CYTDA|nr:hypothetical protein [Cytobacillus dafuensis]QED47415.1 hypothetical protein FSZ17_09210 [Cytobacillus dafuensis]